ncbi:hypothetical protein SVAN01_03527 [Stagonosporopsis vannaccii]|nr:hypothetical protein SVAN01_03527 [Stagonosporopsis vannaccii]
MSANKSPTEDLDLTSRSNVRSWHATSSSNGLAGGSQILQNNISALKGGVVVLPVASREEARMLCIARACFRQAEHHDQLTTLHCAITVLTPQHKTTCVPLFVVDLSPCWPGWSLLPTFDPAPHQPPTVSSPTQYDIAMTLRENTITSVKLDMAPLLHTTDL